MRDYPLINLPRDIKTSRPGAAEIVARLKREFRHVIVNERLGIEYAAQRMLEAQRRGELAEANRLSLILGEGLEIIATDDDRTDTAFLKLFLIPGEYAVVRFFNEEHERDSAVLLDRCRSALT